MNNKIDELNSKPSKMEPIIKISADKMTANLEIPAPAPGVSYTVEQLTGILEENGVRQGIDKEVLQDMIDSRIYYCPMPVARGKESVNGEDGYYKYLFQIGKQAAPKLLADGTVDYLNVDLFETVKVGQVVAEYILPTNGEFGYAVTGEVRVPKKGASLPVLKGSGFTVSEDKTKYIAVLNGKIELKNGAIEITNVYTTSGDLDISIGNIRFDGDVHIMGNVISGLSIVATGDVLIDGIVENAYIKSGKDVILKKGMMGGGIGKIEANGNVSGKFFESTTVTAQGFVKANYFLNCYVVSEDCVEASGYKGVIIGGSIRALQKIQAQGIGNAAEAPTVVETGLSVEYMNKYQALLQNIAKIEAEIEVFRRNLDMYDASAAAREKPETGKAPVISESVLGKVRQALQIKRQELERNMALQEKMSQALTQKGKSNITVIGMVYRGVRVVVDFDVMNITSNLRAVQFVKGEDGIAVRDVML